MKGMVRVMEEKGYPAECSKCGCQFEATKSIFHEMGIFYLGHRKCPDCGTNLNLTFDYVNQRMITKPFEEYRKLS